MKYLHRNWKRILRKSWNIRLILLAGLLSGVEVALPFMPIALPQGGFAAASLIVTMAAFVARLIAQKELNDDVHS